MATTQNTFTGDGSNLGPFSFTFKWLEPTDIKVTVAGVLKTVGTHYNLQNLNYSTKTGGQVLFTAGNAPANNASIVVYRQTDDSDLAATFYSGSAIRAQDLNNNFVQGLYVTQEANNNVITANTTANTALANSNTAITTANAATATANTASSNASAAVATANIASTNASNAVSTANTASANAAAAVSTANTASSNATTALNTANATAAAQAALEANVYDATELDAGQLDNRYYTETELNAGQLDTRYYTETEIDAQRWNKTTETIASNESWVSNDTTIPTTAAINNRLIDLINDVGAYVVVNSEVTFPNAGIVDAGGSPDAGVLVAVTDATGLTWNGSGVSTNATTSNSTAVTITGITGTSPISNCGMQVLSTATLHNYTFVRWVVGSNVAQTISDNINEILLVDSNAAAAAASQSAAAAAASAASTSASNAASSASAAASSASAASTSASNASTSASNAATSASSAANAVTAINNLGYYLNWGLITDAVGTTSDYGTLV
jgi:chemotaxis protein histidine kinase CheA